MEDFELLEMISTAYDVNQMSDVELKPFALKCCENEDYIEEDIWLVCGNCGNSRNNTSIQLSSKKESMLYYRNSLEYSRIKYFNEYLSYLEGHNKKYYEIPKEIVSTILTNLKIIYNEITYEIIYKIMKKNKINKYTKHIPYFCKTYLNIDFPKFSLNEKTIYLSKFELLLKKFSAVPTSQLSRKNFFSFGFLINKFRPNDKQLQFFNISDKSIIQQNNLYEKTKF